MFRNATIKGGAMAAIFATALALAGCGTTPGDRAVSGGLLGAGGGAAIGSLYGDAGKGAVIGGVGGAALGALTTPPPGYYDRYGYYDRSGYYNGYYGSGYTRCVRYSSYSGRCVEWRRY
jgi:osmotically inducible lipoprotein OsmB